MNRPMTVVLGDRRRQLLGGHRRRSLILFLVFFLTTLFAADCWVEVREYEKDPIVWGQADAVVVLGAAVWPGGVPSPALRERTKEAVRLLQEGYASLLITTGGVGTYPPSEASVAGRLAGELGVPETKQLREEQSTNTWQSAVAVAKMALENDIDKVIVVSDGFHLARAKHMFEDNGLQVEVAPAANVYLSSSWLRYELRETAAMMAYRLGLRL